MLHDVLPRVVLYWPVSESSVASAVAKAGEQSGSAQGWAGVAPSWSVANRSPGVSFLAGQESVSRSKRWRAPWRVIPSWVPMTPHEAPSR